MTSLWCLDAPTREELEKQGFEIVKKDDCWCELLKYGNMEMGVTFSPGGYLDEIHCKWHDSYRMTAKLFSLFPDFRVVHEDEGMYKYGDLLKHGASEEEIHQFLIQASDTMKEDIIKELEKEK